MNTKLGLLVVFILLATLFPIQRYIDSRRPPVEAVEHVMFISSGKAIKRFSFGFDGIMADLYWLRSVQYYGRQLIDPTTNELTFQRKVRYDLLYPLLDITTTLDPQYIEAYRFGALFLPDYNYEQALTLLNKGIEQNPDNWRLYQNLGTLYWSKKDYKNASDAFFKGGEKPGGPSWMKVLGGVMLTQGGSRQTACQIYNTFYEDAINNNDQMTKGQMEDQIKRLYAYDEVDYMNELIQRFKEATDQCPGSIKALVPTLKQDTSSRTGSCGQFVKVTIGPDGEPISPTGEKYRFDEKKCKVLMPFELYEP